MDKFQIISSIVLLILIVCVIILFMMKKGDDEGELFANEIKVMKQKLEDLENNIEENSGSQSIGPRGPPGQTGPIGPAGGTHQGQGYIRNLGKSLFLNRTAKTGINTAIFLSENSYQSPMYWMYSSQGSPYGSNHIVNYHPNRLATGVSDAECMSVDKATKKVIMAKCNPNDKAQMWNWNGTDQIINEEHQLALDVKDTVLNNNNTNGSIKPNGKSEPMKPISLPVLMLAEPNTSSLSQKFSWG